LNAPKNALERPTVARALAGAAITLTAAGVADARLETEVLLGHALNSDRTNVLAHLRDPLLPGAASRFAALVARRGRREPLAYVVGAREFYGVQIACSPSALIPRPETEMLVDAALEAVPARGSRPRVADVGTGTGAIAIAIALNAPRAGVLAVDASGPALDLARRNVAGHAVADRVELRCADLLDDTGAFDVIVANLPYVAAGDWSALQPEIRAHEPRGALVGGERGTELIERLLRETPPHLLPGGVVALEIGATQGEASLAIATECFPRACVRIVRDFAGHDRMLWIRDA